MQRFCTHDPETGEKRAKPFNTDLTANNGLDLATQVIQWVGNNMPGWTYGRKADSLVISLLDDNMLNTGAAT